MFTFETIFASGGDFFQIMEVIFSSSSSERLLAIHIIFN